MNLKQIKQNIASNIKPNNNNDITANVMSGVLNNMADFSNDLFLSPTYNGENLIPNFDFSDGTQQPWSRNGVDLSKVTLSINSNGSLRLTSTGTTNAGMYYNPTPLLTSGTYELSIVFKANGFGADKNFTVGFENGTKYTTEFLGNSTTWSKAVFIIKPTTINTALVIWTNGVNSIDFKSISLRAIATNNSLTTDQKYTPTSNNAQSGVAVAEAINSVPKVIVDQEFNPVSENAIANNLVTNAVQVLIEQKKQGSELESNSTMTWVTGKYLDTKGVEKTLDRFSYGSNYIPIIAGNKYSFISSGIAIIWYNNNNVVISTSGGSEDQPLERTFTAPNGATKCRVNVANSVKSQFSFIENGNTKIPDLSISTSQIIDYSTMSIDSIKNLKRGEIQIFDFNSAKINGNVIISGDSTIASYLGGVAIADIIKSTESITNIAIPGNTILQQLSEWNKLSASVKSSANYVFVQIGLNDLEPTTTQDIIKTNYDTYIYKIQNDCPNAKIILGTMLPCKQRFINLYGETLGLVSYGNWLYLNEYIRNLKSVSATSTAHTWLLNDGLDNLDSIFDTGDNIHENTKGRLIIAYSWIMASFLS